MDDLCTACLCGDRKLYYITETGHEQLYSRILNEIPVYDFSQVLVQVCWECKSLLRRFDKFKHQVKHSYGQLLKCVGETKERHVLKTTPHLQIQEVFQEAILPTVKLEVSATIKNENAWEEISQDVKSPVCGQDDDDDSRGAFETWSEAVEVKGRDEPLVPKVRKKNGKKIKSKKRRKLKSGKKKVKSVSVVEEKKDLVVDAGELNGDGRGTEEFTEETETVPVNGPGPDVKPARTRSTEVLPDKPQCAECGKQFSSRKTYRYHIEVLHKGKNRHPCPRCGKVYQWKSNLGRHLRTHTARDSDELYCEKCDKRFASVATYRQHLRNSRRHVSESDFNFVCNECGQKFVTKTRLRDHIDWEHLKTIKFRCELCNKPFKTYTSLYVHIQNVHRNKEKKDNLCHVCGKSYQNPAKLRYHIVAMHTSETPYQCEQCDASFGWYSSLYRHVKEVHYKIKMHPKRAKKTKKEQVPPSWAPLRADLLSSKRHDSLPTLLAQPFIVPTAP